MEAEALLLLLLRKGSKKALADDSVSTLVRSQRLSRAVQSAVIEGRARAAELSLARTKAQLKEALGIDRELTTGRQLAAESATAASAEAHAVTSRWLESQLPEGRAFLPEFERRASWEAAQAFNQARTASLLRLPSRVREQLWLRWDTAGDRRVCPRCDRRDGQIVKASEGFDPSAPLHGSCRCSETLLTGDEVDAVALPTEAPARRAAPPAPVEKAATAKPKPAAPTKAWTKGLKKAGINTEASGFADKQAAKLFPRMPKAEEIKRAFTVPGIETDIKLVVNPSGMVRVEMWGPGVMGERTFRRGADGVLRATHESFYLQAHLQGKGFGSAMLRSQEEVYKLWGVQEITIPRAAETGRYFWAKKGFIPDDMGAMRSKWTAHLKGAGKSTKGAAQASMQDIVDHPEGKQFLMMTEPYSATKKLEF